ncbi:MAG: alpha/beta hydrolase, partial [Pseudomonadota bacterium]
MSRFAIIEGNAPPKGASATDIMAHDGVRLRVGMFPREHAKGTFLVLTGWSEFIEKYFETVEELHARGFAAIAMDWRGQGLSERFASRPTTSHINSFSLYKDDIDRLIELAEEKQLPKPYYALTHSMGGAPMLQRLADGETRLRAAVLCAPLTALTFNRLETNAIRVLARSAVALRLGNTSVPGQPDTIPPFDETALTSDPERY